MSSATGEADKQQPSLTSTQQCLRFSLAEIQSATNDFDDELVIGQGGFGKVYKGSISIEETSHVVAIKRLDSMSNQGAPEFRAEIEMLSKLRHCHLVSLIGFCIDSNEMILIYAYMPHGTLYHHLHEAETPLNWVQRLKIAIGAGRGLDYLHTGVGTHHGVIHRDVKTSNILLDDNWEATISDFGLSKIGPTNQSSFVDVSVKGTFGYLDPEYFYTRKLTRKTDVYAFGVVLFELLSRRLAVDGRNGEDQCSLVRWAQRCVKERKLDQIVDPNIRGTIFPKCLRGFARIADRCLLSAVKERPTMAEIVVSLQALLELQLRHDNSVEQSGITGVTWKIHKYLVSATKQNADLKCFKHDELRRATKNFGTREYMSSNSREVIYKGWINKTASSWFGLPVTIRIHDFHEHVGRLDLKILKEFNHPNLVEPIGYSLEGEQVFFVYEFMPKGNFEDLLHSGVVAQLPLVTKVKIALGIARGIVFLNKTQDQVGADYPWDAPVSESPLARHRILLDEDFTAKLSDYGVSKLLHGGYPRNILGLIDLDFAYHYYPGCGPFQPQSNLMGFTVIFTELFTGKQVIKLNKLEEICGSFINDGSMSLVDIAHKCFEICNDVDSESRILSIFREVYSNMSEQEILSRDFRELLI